MLCREGRQMHMRVNISLQADTLDRLDQYAMQEHMSRSQAITRLVWEVKVKNPQASGQMTVDDLTASSRPKKSKRA